MLQTLMVFSNNDLFNVNRTELDENVDRLIQQQVYQHQHHQHLQHPVANVMVSASSSPIQDYHLLDPSSSSSSSQINALQQSHHPQNHLHPQQHQQQFHQPQQQHHRHPPQQPRRQRSLPQPPPPQPPQPSLQAHTRHQQYPQQQHQQQQPSQVAPSPQQQQNMKYSIMVSPMMVGNISAPSSPSYSVVKTEEGLHQNLEYLIYPSFDMQSPSTPQQQQPHHIIPSQRHGLSSPQQRLLPYGEVPFMHQRQHSQHQQQIRIQQQQQQRAIEQHHQQQQYQQYNSHHQLMYDPSSTNQGRSSISSAISMSMPLSVSIPVTSGSSTLMIHSSPNSSTTNNNSANLFTSSGGAATPMPFFNPPSSAPLSTAVTLSNDESSTNKMTTAAMMASFQHRGVHPQAPAVSPKRQRSNSGHQHRFALAQLSPSTSIEGISEFHFQSSSPHNTIAAAAAGVTITATTTSVAGAKRPRRSSGASSTSRSGAAAAATGLQAVETEIDARASKVAKTLAVSSAPVAATAAAAETKSSTKTTARRTSAKGSSSSSAVVVENSRTFSSSSSAAHAQPYLPNYTPHHTHTQQVQTHPATTNTASKTAAAGSNVTHPRRAAQNRAAQRTFRNRRKAYIKDMEQKVLELHQMRARFEEIQVENREIWRRYRVLEGLILQSGQTPPAFATTLTPFHETDAGIAAQAQSAAHAAAVAAALLNASSQSGGMDATAAGNLSRLSSEIDGEGEDEAMFNQLGHGFHSNRHGGLEQLSEEDHDEGDEDDEDGEHTVDPSYSSSSSSRIDPRIKDLNVRRPL